MMITDEIQAPAARVVEFLLVMYSFMRVFTCLGIRLVPSAVVAPRGRVELWLANGRGDILHHGYPIGRVRHDDDPDLKACDLN